MHQFRRFCSLGLVGGALGVASLMTGGALPAAAADRLLVPTPLILKDGRIAKVSVHVLPFSNGGTDLGSAVATGLDQLIGEIATDCFLTAQVIGHVGGSEVGAADTLAAHRLARSRADSIQTSLIDGGLPANAIASVWDWQFMVRDARATLWIFRLTEGEDCTGAPLEGARPPLVARAAPEPAPTPTPAPRADPPPRQVAASEVAVPAGPAPLAAAAPTVTQPLPAVSRAPARAEPSRERPAVSAPPPPAAAATAALSPSPSRRVAPSADPEGAVAITFATNSSYFPPGVRERLDGLLTGLEAGKRYRVEVEVAVSGADQVVGAETQEEARRYNRWLAERRLERVQDWLDEHAAGRELALEPRFVPNDNSRRLVVRIAPAA
jgi:hypothetical protein